MKGNIWGRGEILRATRWASAAVDCEQDSVEKQRQPGRCQKAPREALDGEPGAERSDKSKNISLVVKECIWEPR